MSLSVAFLATFLAASLTDLLDGRIARKYNLITDFGKLVDPFADKVMVLTALFSMAIGSPAIPPVVPWGEPEEACIGGFPNVCTKIWWF